jgi:hypothetical protein
LEWVEMRCIPRIVLVVLFAVTFGASVARSQVFSESPGNLLIGGPGPPLLPGAGWDICGTFLIAFAPSAVDVYAALPEEGTIGVDFTVSFSDEIFVFDRQILLAGAVDAEIDDPDMWSLRFENCLPTSDAFLPIVRYFIAPMVPAAVNEWMCISPPTQPEPSWATCAGGVVPGGVFPPAWGPLREGCFPLNPDFGCPLPVETSSWSAVKALY